LYPFGFAQYESDTPAPKPANRLLLNAQQKLATLKSSIEFQGRTALLGRPNLQTTVAMLLLPGIWNLELFDSA